MKKRKGITLIAIVLTTIILLILAGVGVKIGVEQYQYIKYKEFETDLLEAQKQVEQGMAKLGTGPTEIINSNTYREIAGKLDVDQIWRNEIRENLAKRNIPEVRTIRQIIGGSYIMLVRPFEMGLKPDVVTERYKNIWVDAMTLKPVVYPGYGFKVYGRDQELLTFK